MPIYLRQSTASQEVQIGKFVDDTDGKTAKTALTIANTDAKLWKEGATAQVSKNSGGGTHIANGWYYLTLDATDTNTVGNLVITVDVSGALSVQCKCLVLSAAVYDVKFGTTAPSTYAGGAVASVTGAVGSVTGSVGSVTGNVAGITGVTFPATVASPTNITGGTITTVTNLTNAPTAGDLTAAMKASVTAAVPTAGENATQVRTELTTELARIDETISSRSTFAPVIDGDTGKPVVVVDRFVGDVGLQQVAESARDISNANPAEGSVGAGIAAAQAAAEETLEAVEGMGGAPDLRGPGADSVTINIKSDAVNVADADVWITADEAGTNTVAGTLQTNAGGNVTFLLDEGETYYLWMQKDSINSIQGEEFVAEAD